MVDVYIPHSAPDSGRAQVFMALIWVKRIQHEIDLRLYCHGGNRNLIDEIFKRPGKNLENQHVLGGWAGVFSQANINRRRFGCWWKGLLGMESWWGCWQRIGLMRIDREIGKPTGRCSPIMRFMNGFWDMVT